METLDIIIKVSQVITALGVIIGAIFAAVRWLIKQNGQDKEIEATDKHIDEVEEECEKHIVEVEKECEAKIDSLKTDMDDKWRQIQTEQTLMVYGILASLKGLKEQGCNGPVTEAIAKLEKHLNIQAHK